MVDSSLRFNLTIMKHIISLALFLVVTLSTFPQVTCGERNLFIVLINTYNQLFVEHEIMDLKDLKDAVKEFIANPNDDLNYSDKDEKEIPLLGNVMVSRGIVSIQCDRGTTYQAYIDVQNELEKAFNELRNEFALARFNTPYKKLSKEKRRAINMAIPKNISEAEPRRVRN